MTFFAVPSFLAIVIKLGLLVRFWSTIQQRPVLMGLFGCFLVLSIIEFGSFFAIDRADEFVWVMRAYYIVAVFTGLMILMFTVELVDVEQPWIMLFVTIMGCFVAIACVVPDVIISGVEVIGVTAARVPGHFYFVWPLYMAGTLCSAVAMLAYGYRRHPKRDRQRACFLILLALLPVVFAALLVFLLMALGFAINAVAIISITLIAFMLTLAVSEQRAEVFNALRVIPGTPERRLVNNAKKIQSKIVEHAINPYSSDGSLYKELLKEYEQCMMELSVWAADGNRSLAARRLGMSRATLLRKSNLN